jgi:hypothetical protein
MLLWLPWLAAIIKFLKAKFKELIKKNGGRWKVALSLNAIFDIKNFFKI